MSGLIYPRVRQLCGFLEAAGRGGVPRQALDPCQNDADSQSVSPVAPPSPAEVRILHGLYTQQVGSASYASLPMLAYVTTFFASFLPFCCTPPFSILMIWASKNQSCGRLWQDQRPGCCHASWGSSSSISRSLDATAMLLPPDASLHPTWYYAQPASLVGPRSGSRDVKVSKQKLTIAYCAEPGLRYLCAILSQSPLSICPSHASTPTPCVLVYHDKGRSCVRPTITWG